MHKLFVKTRNVKNFIDLMNNLIDKSNEVPKMGLIYGDPGLGKSRTAVWWATQNDAVYVRVQNNMTSHGILEKVVEDLGEDVSENYYLLNIIHNEAIHCKNNTDNYTRLYSKLENLIIRQLILSI